MASPGVAMGFWVLCWTTVDHVQRWANGWAPNLIFMCYVWSSEATGVHRDLLLLCQEICVLHGITLWLFNIAMENCPFTDDFPTKTSIYNGFPIAMLNNQMVYPIDSGSQVNISNSSPNRGGEFFAQPTTSTEYHCRIFPPVFSLQLGYDVNSQAVCEAWHLGCLKKPQPGRSDPAKSSWELDIRPLFQSDYGRSNLARRSPRPDSWLDFQPKPGRGGLAQLPSEPGRSHFPEALQRLTLGNFNQRLQGVSFPSALQSLMFGCNFDHALERTKLPNSLQSLRLGTTLNDMPDMPDGLQNLTFSNERAWNGWFFRAVY